MREEAPNEDQKAKITKKDVLLICKKYVQKFFPITSWLPNYRWREHFVGDFMAGIALGIIHISNGLAFAILADVSPIMGLYTSCFSVFIYCFFGTAAISSYGPVAIVSFLTGDAVSLHQHSKFSNDQIVVVITFLLGIYNIIAYLTRFAVITNLLTYSLTSGFITGCAIRVILGTFKIILGVHVVRSVGYLSLIYDTYNTFKEVPNTNIVTLSLSCSILVLFTLNVLVLKPLIKKCTRFTIPLEILVMIAVMNLAFFLKFDQMGVVIIRPIPTGFPDVKLPNFEAVHSLLIDALCVFLVNLTATLGIALRNNKLLKPDQELFAIGITSVISSCFSTMPMGNSIMRTIVAQSSGSNTLLSSIISSIIVLMVALFMGPFFHSLPLCYLGCEIIFYLSFIVVKLVGELPIIIKLGWEDTIIWFLTAFATMLISVQIGLGIGLTLSLRKFLQSLKEPDETETRNVQVPETAAQTATTSPKRPSSERQQK